MKIVISKLFTCSRHAHGPVNFTKYYAKARENCQTDVLYGRRTYSWKAKNSVKLLSIEVNVSVQSISKNQVQLNLPLNISGLWALFAMLFRDEARLELFVFFKIRFPSRVERGNFLFWQSRDSLRFFGGAAGWWCCCWWGCWSFAASRRLWWSLSSVAASTELEAATGVDCG